MTRGGVMPCEDAVAKLEKDFPNTTAGSLAKIVHARIKLNARDYAGTASLLDSSAIAQYTVIGDYALWMKAGAEEVGRRVEARAAYEKPARTSQLARAKHYSTTRKCYAGWSSSGAAHPGGLVARDNASACRLTAKAYEQTGNSAGTREFRRLYFGRQLRKRPKHHRNSRH
jgi:hypothetical protein